MKLVSLVLIICFCSCVMSYGCAGVMAPVNGAIYTSVKAPQSATNAAEYSKLGTSSCTSVLGIVATGDASIKAAMENGKIAKIHHVDCKSMSVLGLFAKFTTYVYGE